MLKSTVPQNYPRITDTHDREYGCLDASLLVSHKRKISPAEMERMIRDAIRKANQKSSRRSFSIPPDATPEDVLEVYHKAGKDLFKYFRKYCGDPASTAYQMYRRHYRAVGAEQFHNRTVQRGRMNSGWRYQFLLLDCAIQSGRFRSASDLGMAEADFLWPFFANYSYEEIMTFVLDVLLKISAGEELSTQMKMPEEVLDHFGKLCRDAGLVDAAGYFDNPYKLVKFFCQ